MSYAAWVEQHCQVKEKLANDEWLILCPFHDNRQTPSCCINVRKGVYNCYSCGAKGGIDRLAEKINAPLAGRIFDLKATKRQVRKVKNDLAHHDEEVSVHPDGWLDQYRVDDDLYHQWAMRGVHRKTVDDLELGYDEWKTAKWGTVHTLCIPVRDVNNNVLGIIRRMVGDNLPPGQRYFYPYGFKISWHLFNAYKAALNEDHPLVITEGSIDAILMHQEGYPAVSILGAALHTHQATILRTMPHDDVVLMLDNDKAGRVATMAIAPELMAAGFGVKLAVDPSMKQPLKDAGDMSPKQRRLAIEEAQSYLRLRIAAQTM